MIELCNAGRLPIHAHAMQHGSVHNPYHVEDLIAGPTELAGWRGMLDNAELLNRLTDKAKAIIGQQYDESCRQRQGFVGTDHLLLGLVK
jgi:hypothetical protein